MPKIGYGSNKKTKHMMPNGFYKFKVSNVADLDMLLMHNTKMAAEIAHNVSARNRVAIAKRCEELGIFCTNRFSRVQAEEAE